MWLCPWGEPESGAGGPEQLEEVGFMESRREAAGERQDQSTNTRGARHSLCLESKGWVSFQLGGKDRCYRGVMCPRGRELRASGSRQGQQRGNAEAWSLQEAEELNSYPYRLQAHGCFCFALVPGSPGREALTPTHPSHAMVPAESKARGACYLLPPPLPSQTQVAGGAGMLGRTSGLRVGHGS